MSHPDHLTRLVIYHFSQPIMAIMDETEINGTEKGTVLLADINPEKSSQCYYYPYPYCKDIVKESDPKELTAVGNTLFSLPMTAITDANSGNQTARRKEHYVTDINLGESSSDPRS